MGAFPGLSFGAPAPNGGLPYWAFPGWSFGAPAPSGIMLIRAS